MLLGASLYLVPLLTATTACAKYFANGASEKYFTNEWSVQISSNNEIEAERVATEVKSIMKDFLDGLDLLSGSHVSKWSLDLHSATLREQLMASDYHHPSVSEVHEEQTCQGPFSKEYLDELKILLFMLLLALWGVALIVVFVNL